MRPFSLCVTGLILVLACDRAPIESPIQPPTFSTSAGSLTFSNTPLLRPEGTSEPAIAIADGGTMGITSLGWLGFGTALWTGSFGATPAFQGVVDAGLRKPGRPVFGGGDADLDFGSTGTLHITTLIVLVNPVLRVPSFGAIQIGVSAIACPHAASNFDLRDCHTKIIDQTTSDRQWITSDGARVYIAYHDPLNAALVHVQRSDDDGFTWHRVGDPIVGQGRATGDATFNNIEGPIVADGYTHNVYDIYVNGEASIQKGTTANFNNIVVSRSADGGVTWTAVRVFHAPLNTALTSIFPTLAVDPANGQLHAAWSDGHTVFYSTSSDEGRTWSSPVAVNVAPANTAVFPWIAARSGVVSLVYYGTTASSKDDDAAAWKVFLARTDDNGANFRQSLVSNTANHIGGICTEGVACKPGTRNLLDLFEIALDPATGRAAVIYTDDTLTETDDGDPLPQVVLAIEQ